MCYESAAYAGSLWIMEFLVLLLIAYEVFSKVWRDRRTNRRKITLETAMVRGQHIQQQAPPVNKMADVGHWARSVDSWIDEVATLLRTYSSQAEASFSHEARYIPPNQLHIAEGAKLHYAKLLVRLDNLRGIMEKPDVYY